LLRGPAEIGDEHFAAASRAVEREEPWLQADERDGVRRPNRAPHDAAAVGVHAARNIEREHRAALAIHVVDEAGIVALEVAREADAEEAVDDECPRFVVR